MTIRQEDIDKLMHRITNMARELIEPDGEYHVTVLIAEKTGTQNGINSVSLALGSTAEPILAMEFCNMSAAKFAQMAVNQRPDIAQVEALIGQVIAAFEQHFHMTLKEEPSDEPTVTKH